MWSGLSKSGASRQSCISTILGRLKRVASRLSSSDFAQQPTRARRPSWLVVERYLKNLIEKSPASVCLNSFNYIIALATCIIPVLMKKVTYKNVIIFNSIIHTLALSWNVLVNEIYIILILIYLRRWILAK